MMISFKQTALSFLFITTISTNAVGASVALEQNLAYIERATQEIMPFTPSVDTLKKWNEHNGENAPQDEKELLAQYLTFYISAARAVFPNNVVVKNMLSDKTGVERFISCVASNPRNKTQISLFDAGYGRNIDQWTFYFLYPKENPRGWGVNFAQADELRTNFRALVKKFPKHSEYMNDRMYQYHPLIFAKNAFDARISSCIERMGNIVGQAYQADEFNSDPLNQAKGETYKFKFDQTPPIAFKMMPDYLNSKDYTKYIAEKTIKNLKPAE